MKIIRNSIIPFEGYIAINLFGFLFCREEAEIDNVTVNHESIHTAQMKETLYLFFYIFYFLEYLIKLIIYCNHRHAYRGISFEQEAYLYENDEEYLHNRKHFNWFKYIFH